MKILSKMKCVLLILSFSALYTGSANAYLINIDATKNGYSNPVERTLSAGTYEIIPVSGKYKAWSAWDLSNPKHTVCGDSNGCVRTGNPKPVGWLNSYMFASPDLVDVVINGILAAPAADGKYKVKEYPSIVFADEGTALANAWTAEFTLTKAGTVSFMVPDADLYDNAGGMSLHVVPEPSILALMALGLIAVGFSSRRKA